MGFNFFKSSIGSHLSSKILRLIQLSVVTYVFESKSKGIVLHQGQELELQRVLEILAKNFLVGLGK